jgi:ribonucleoside-triphosphate reductase (formate)
MGMINKAFCEIMMEGDAQGRLFSWPIPTYNITNDFDWDNKNYKPIWEMTAKYGIPYFANYMNSDMNPDDARSMCCRLRIDNRELKKRGGGLFGANPLTGSIGVVTINLPRIGHTTKTKKEYLKQLDHLMDLAKKSLVIKRKFIEKYIEAGLYPYSRFYLADIKKRFKEYYKNHFNTIGILGMNESMINFFKDKEKDITSKEGREFALEIMDHMRERLMKYQKETNSLFNLEATPGEGTTYKFAKADRKKFGKSIITATELGKKKSAAPYYTNSTHLPVGYTDDLFEVLDLQDEFQTKYTGGTVVHLFLGEKMPSGEAVKKLVKKVCENYSLPYFSITPTFSVCPKHGYLVGEHKYCPECDRELGYQEGMPFDEK